MSKPEQCPHCKADYKYSSALYAYYKCDHAFEKPLNKKETGRWVYYPSPYDPKNLTNQTGSK